MSSRPQWLMALLLISMIRPELRADSSPRPEAGRSEAPVSRADVSDPIRMFAEETVEEANRLLAELQRASHWDVVIQTAESLNGRDLVEAAQKGMRDRNVKGVYLLIVRGDKKLHVEVSPEARNIVSAELRQSIVKSLADAFRQEQFDRGLSDAVNTLRQTLQAKPRLPAESPRMTRTETRRKGPSSREPNHVRRGVLPEPTTPEGQTIPITGGAIEVFFSPHGGCTEAAVRTINAARREILVQAYSFTSIPIVKALMAARDRGVKVQIILDRSNETARYTEAEFLSEEGMAPLIDDKHAIAHNKILIIDGQTVVTGSFNFTKQAEQSNAENLLVIEGVPDLARRYIENWHRHEAHSRPYQKKEKGSRGRSSGRGHALSAEPEEMP